MYEYIVDYGLVGQSTIGKCRSLSSMICKRTPTFQPRATWRGLNRVAKKTLLDMILPDYDCLRLETRLKA
jgi:hypothetical protein